MITDLSYEVPHLNRYRADAILPFQFHFPRGASLLDTNYLYVQLIGIHVASSLSNVLLRCYLR